MISKNLSEPLLVLLAQWFDMCLIHDWRLVTRHVFSLVFALSSSLIASLINFSCIFQVLHLLFPWYFYLLIVYLRPNDHFFSFQLFLLEKDRLFSGLFYLFFDLASVFLLTGGFFGSWAIFLLGTIETQSCVFMITFKEVKARGIIACLCDSE